MTLCRVQNKYEVLHHVSKRSVLYAEHHLIYVSPCASTELVEYSKELTPLALNRNISYLGYTVDEYNMLLASSKVFQKGISLFFAPNQEWPLSGNILVCASGPSLEEQIDTVRELSKNLVVCAASSSGVLLKHGIRVDYIALVEREESVADDYAQLVLKYPHAKDIRIIMSSTCSSRLIDLFDSVAVYFRGVLAPLALYSESTQQILVGEGPQSINAAFSFALSLRPERICFAGCDLGSTDSLAQRSVNALGNCERVWNQQVRGNLADKIYTNALMIDSRDVIEQLIDSQPDIDIFNISNGLYIDNASPISHNQYLEKSRFFASNQQEILEKRPNNWWLTLPSSNMMKDG